MSWPIEEPRPDEALAQADQPLYDRRDRSGDPRGPAWAVTRNPRAAVVTLNHWGRDDYNLDWERQTRAEIGDVPFERQFGRNWSTPSGACYYPEFAANVREVAPGQFQGWYVRQAKTVLSTAPFLRGWDFGYYRPAVVLAQWSREQGLLWVYREVRLEDMLIHDFRDLVRYLCGQATLEELRAERRHAALAWIEREERERFYGVPIPWLKPGCKFYDFAAYHEMRNTSALAASNEERTSARVLGQKGIAVRGQKASWDDRSTIMRFLLREGHVRGFPRLLIDPACKWLLKGMAGGLVKPTKAQKFGGPKRDRMYEDVHDALTYIPAGLGLLQKIPALERLSHKGGDRTPVPPMPRPGAYVRPRREVSAQDNTWARVHYQAR